MAQRWVGSNISAIELDPTLTRSKRHQKRGNSYLIAGFGDAPRASG
jgi:hypothetical protein